jgi:hypothetical protein
MVKFVNLTPHEIVEMTAELRFPSEGIARVSVEYMTNSEINGIPLFEAKYGEVEGLPEPKERTIYIVSSLVLGAVKDTRSDVVAPGELVRDDLGKPIGCLGFKKG